MSQNLNLTQNEALRATLRDYEASLAAAVATPRNLEPALRLKADEIAKRVAAFIYEMDDTWSNILCGDDYWAERSTAIEQLALGIKDGLNAIVQGEI
jgi:hypothetical protein